MRRALALGLWVALSCAASAQVTLALGPTPPVVADGGRVTIVARATATDSATVTARVDGPRGWRTTGGRTLALAPGAARSVFVIAAPPPGTAAGTYPVRIALLEPDGTVAASVTADVRVPARPAAAVSIERPPGAVVAGRRATLAVRIANAGNVPLALALDLDAPPDWAARLETVRVTVAPGETAATTVALAVPASLLASRGARVRVTATDGGAIRAEGVARVLAVPEPGALRLARHEVPGRIGVEVGTRTDPLLGTRAGAALVAEAGGLLREGGRTRLQLSLRAPALGGDAALASRSLYRLRVEGPDGEATVGDAAVDHGPVAGVLVGAGATGEVAGRGWTAGALALADRTDRLPGDRTAGLRLLRTLRIGDTDAFVGASGLVRAGPRGGALVGLRGGIGTPRRLASGSLRLDAEVGLGGDRLDDVGGAARAGLRRGRLALSASARSTPASFPLLTAGTLDARAEAALTVRGGFLSARAARFEVASVAGRPGATLESARLTARLGERSAEALVLRYARDGDAVVDGALRLDTPVLLGPVRADLRATASHRRVGADADTRGGADLRGALRLGPDADLLLGLGGALSTRVGPSVRPLLGAAVRPVPSVSLRASASASLRLRDGAQDAWSAEGAATWAAPGGRRLTLRVYRFAPLTPFERDPLRPDASRWRSFLTLTQPLAVPLARSRESGAVRGRVVDAETGAGRAGVPVFVGQAAALTDADGGFALSGLPPGAYELTVGGAGSGASPYALGAVPVTVGGGAVTSVAALATLDGAEIVGRAIERAASRTGRDLGEGRPLGGVAVEATDAAGQTVRGVTDRDGAFRFVGLAPGRYVVALALGAAPRGTAAAPVEVEVGPGAVETVVLEAVARRRTFRRME